MLPEWVADPPPAEANTAGRFPHGGVLADLADYVHWTIPDTGRRRGLPGLRPGLRVRRLPRPADVRRGPAGAAARRQRRARCSTPTGAELVFDNAWEEAPATTLSTDESAWLSRLDACTGAVQWTSLCGRRSGPHRRSPACCTTTSPATLATAWTVVVLDPDEPLAANWHLDGGVLRQDVDLADGTVYLSEDVDVADVALETSGVGRLRRVRAGLPLAAERRPLPLQRRTPAPPAGRGAGRCRPRAVVVAGRLPARRRDPARGAGRRSADPLPGGRASGLRRRRTPIRTHRRPGPSGSTPRPAATAAFDEMRARSWPGARSPERRGHVAELEASRPLFTDAFEDLDGFDGAVPARAGPPRAAARPAPARRSSRDRRRARRRSPRWRVTRTRADYVVECNARPMGRGSFGLVARHGAGGYLALELEPGQGRTLVARLSGSGDIDAVRVLWQDPAAVEVGRDYAVVAALRGRHDHGVDRRRRGDRRRSASPGAAASACCRGSRRPRAARSPTSSSGPRRASRCTAGASPPRATSACRTCSTPSSAGPGRCAEAAPRQAAVQREAAAAAAVIADAQATLDVARSALAVAVDAGDASSSRGSAKPRERPPTPATRRPRTPTWPLAAALGLPWRPHPPVVEVCTVDDAGSYSRCCSRCRSRCPASG